MKGLVGQCVRAVAQADDGLVVCLADFHKWECWYIGSLSEGTGWTECEGSSTS